MMRNLFAFLSCLACATASAATDVDALRQLIAQHRAARESIRTLVGQYEYERLHPTRSLIASGQYTRTPRSVFITEGVEKQKTNHYLVRNGEVRVVGREWENGRVGYGGTRISSTKMFALCEVWVPLLLSGEGPAGTIMPFDELYERAKRTPEVSRVSLDGRECVRVTVAFDVKGFGKDVEINLVVWHDIKRNYLVLRKEYRQVGGDVRKEFQITDFEEPTPGVFVPVKSHFKAFAGSERTGEWEVSLRNVRVNTDIAEQSLVLPTIPSGILIRDGITEQQYRIDSNWNRIGPATHSPPLTIELSGATSQADDRPSQSEPTSFAQWLVFGSVGLCVVTFMWVAVRYFRRTRAAGQS